MMLIGLLARIAIPRYREMKLRATAAAIMGDVHAIRVAAFTHYTEKGAFPPDAAPDTLPAELVGNLPTGFTFDRPDFDYDWHVWSMTNGAGNTRDARRHNGARLRSAPRDTPRVRGRCGLHPDRDADAGHVPRQQRELIDRHEKRTRPVRFRTGLVRFVVAGAGFEPATFGL